MGTFRSHAGCAKIARLVSSPATGGSLQAEPWGSDSSMATWIWIVIAIAAVVVIAALVLGARKGREKRVIQKREQTQELRQEAEDRTRRAEERERIAEEHAQQARDERKQAAEVGARADKIDPDRD